MNGRRLILLSAACLVLAQQPQPVRIIRPQRDVAVRPGVLLLIGRVPGPAEWKLDARTVAGSRVGPDVWTAGVQLEPGFHELVLSSPAGEDRMQLEVTPAATWRPHPPAAACSSCHAERAGVWELKDATLEMSCRACHDLQRFAEIHTHNTQVLAECQMCHDPHGGAAKSFLKMSRQIACKQCHG